jgi:uncharacterized membrane protein YbhN (UPF0104 family)
VRLFRYTVAAFAASAIAPARAGEALRLWTLKQRDGVPIADGAATAVGEKLLDAVAMFLVLTPIPWLVPGLPSWVGSTVIIGICVVVAVVAALAGAVARITAGTRWWSRFFAGMHVLRSPRRLAGALAVLIGAWLIDLAMVECVMYSLDIALSPAAALLVLLTINIAIIIPGTPGQVGVHEAGAIVGLDLLHVPSESAIGFAVLYHAIQIVPLVTAGALLEWQLLVGRRDAHAVVLKP